MTCWGCDNHARTGLDGFVQDGCAECAARERAVDIVKLAPQMVDSPEGRAWERDPGALKALIRSACSTKKEYLSLRIAVYAMLKPKEPA